MEPVQHQRKVMFQKSYAKINLFLDVLFLRDDGFREIRTVFSEIDLYDELNFVLTKKSDIQILTEIDELRTQKNLIYLVAIFIQNSYNVKKGCSITLKKNVPISVTLPLRNEPYESEDLFPFFQGLLPEGWYLEIVASTLKIDKEDDYGILLATCKSLYPNQ